MSRAGALVVLATVTAVAGCASRVERLPNPMALPGHDAEAVEATARRVLTELRFEIEYPEASEGRLETDYQTGASWFEFWREDTVGAEQRAESSLHTVRRRARVSVTPTESGSEVSVQVVKERFGTPGTGPGSVGEAYSIYSPTRVSLWRDDPMRSSSAAWIERGRDDLLEQRILERVLVGLEGGAGAP